MTPAPDEKLVRRAQKGDKAAFAELFTRYEGRIFGYLYRMVGDRTWAEDLAQEAFIRAHQHLGQLGPPYDFKSWVYRIAGNLALDGLRRYRDEVPLPDWDSGEATAPEPADQRREGDPEDQARLAEVRAAVWRAIHQLPDNYRQVLTLREIDGLSYNEIADVVGVSLGNVRVTLHRARLQFRDLYGIQVMVEEGRLACQELDVLLSAYVDGELDRTARKRVKAHIEACPACQKKRRDLLAVSSLLAALAPVFPPPTLRPRFLTRLQHLPPPEPAPPGVPGGQPPGRGGGFFGQGPAPWLLAALAGGGAMLLLAAAAILGLPILLRAGPFAPPFHTPTPTPLGTSVVEKSMPSPIPPAAPTDTPTPTPSPTATPTSTPVPPAPTSVPPTSTPTHTPPPPTDTPTPVPTDTPTPPPTSTPQPTSTPDTQPPPAPVPSAPVSGEVLSCRTTVILSWNAVKDPSGVAYHVKLELQVKPKQWELVQKPGPVNGTQVEADVQCGGIYRWAVQAEDGAGNVGPWSKWAQFAIDLD
jgi:RNA polymerase sigma factor (sigma-70 family)